MEMPTQGGVPGSWRCVVLGLLSAALKSQDAFSGARADKGARLQPVSATARRLFDARYASCRSEPAVRGLHSASTMTQHPKLQTTNDGALLLINETGLLFRAKLPTQRPAPNEPNESMS